MADYDRIHPQSSGVGIDRPHTIDHPTQSQPWGSDNYEVPNVNQRAGRTSPDLGDLQRRYDFGNTYTKLSFQRDPFQHLLLAGKQKKFVSDSKFEYAIKRATNTYKRYAYVVGVDESATDQADVTAQNSQDSWNDTAYTHLLTTGLSNAYDDTRIQESAGGVFTCLMMGDYKTHGNLVNKIGKSSSDKQYALGDNLTKPNWFMKDQVIRIPTGASNGGAVTDYVLARITKVSDLIVQQSDGSTQMAQGTFLVCKIIKAADSSNNYVTSIVSNTALLDVWHGTGSDSIAQKLEPKRTYIAGTAYPELSGYGETWKAQPFSTDYGYTQIFKKTAMMSGRAMATALKFGENPWKNEWADKMAEMNWDIAQAGYFGEQYEDTVDGITYTEGLVNFVLNNGNLFSLDTTTKTIDSFLEDMSAFHDPRHTVAQSNARVYFAGTQVWNWLAMMGGFAKNNLELSPNYSMQFSGQGKMAGVSYRQFEVDGQSVRVVRDIHLDGTNVKLIAANMKACKTVALKGNGINRDMAVYPGVKTIKNSGEDYRVDLIQADVGFEFTAPETHAVWT
tara:strand:- start:4109 stop:5791 length:1683 start_codon:yes stop_codon:yes gene_type:complete